MQNDQVKQLPPKKPKQSNVVAGHNEEPKAIEVSSKSVSFSLNSCSYSVIFCVRSLEFVTPSIHIYCIYSINCPASNKCPHPSLKKKLYKEWHTRRQSFLSIFSKETSISWNSAIVHFHVLALFLVLVQNTWKCPVSRSNN